MRSAAAPKHLRVAIYVRQSIDEGTLEYRSVDSQRDTIKAYIDSQRELGWSALPEAYSDAGFSGSNTNRPAFKRLLADIDEGKIDIVVVYKLDRLSRSLVDFVGLMRKFEEKGVACVSTTQPFDTSTSIGRMMVHLLMTFAQFERETIAERVKHKMAAIRKRGMWPGGLVPLGYDLVDKQLVVNEDEAEQVRAIFRLYLEKGSVVSTVSELNARGWRTKSWTGKHGRRIGGARYNVETLRQLLDRVVYIGKIRAGKQAHAGLHEPIIDQALWDSVQARRRQLAPSARGKCKSTSGALLSGLISCGACGETMYHRMSRWHSRSYHYYVCYNTSRRGRSTCPCGARRADEIDAFVVEQIRAIGKDPELVRDTAGAIRAERLRVVAEREAETRTLSLERRRISGEREKLVDAVASGGAGRDTLLARVAEIDERVGQIDQRTVAIADEIVAARGGEIEVDALARALGEFDSVWNELFAPEKAKVIRALIERVTFETTTGVLKITFKEKVQWRA